MSKTPFYHIHFNNLNTEETLKKCADYLNNSNGESVFFVNAHCFNLSVKDKEYLDNLINASLLLNDGIGIKIAAKLKGIKLKENMNGTDFIPKLIALAEEKEKKIFLLGAKSHVIEKTKEELTKRFPKLKIVGYSDGYFSKKPNGEENLIKEINSLKPDMLIVGMGVPFQEKWIMENKNKLNAVRLFVAGGAILDFIAGKVVRAPIFIQKIGMEWLWRLIQEPKRLFKRYLIGNFVFFFNLIKNY